MERQTRANLKLFNALTRARNKIIVVSDIIPENLCKWLTRLTLSNNINVKVLSFTSEENKQCTTSYKEQVKSTVLNNIVNTVNLLPFLPFILLKLYSRNFVELMRAVYVGLSLILDLILFGLTKRSYLTRKKRNPSLISYIISYYVFPTLIGFPLVTNFEFLSTSIINNYRYLVEVQKNELNELLAWLEPYLFLFISELTQYINDTVLFLYEESDIIRGTLILVSHYFIAGYIFIGLIVAFMSIVWTLLDIIAYIFLRIIKIFSRSYKEAKPMLVVLADNVALLGEVGNEGITSLREIPVEEAERVLRAHGVAIESSSS